MKIHIAKYLLASLLILATTVLAACASTSYAPATSPTTTTPTTPSNDTTPPPPPSGQPVTVNISAKNYAFNTKDIAVPAGAEVTVIFDNQEAVPHNFAVYTTPAATEAIFIGDVITGPKTINYQFKAPVTPGTYFFRCDVHPTIMTGVFVVTAQ